MPDSLALTAMDFITSFGDAMEVMMMDVLEFIQSD
jgi:hypothetical protein